MGSCGVVWCGTVVGMYALLPHNIMVYVAMLPFSLNNKMTLYHSVGRLYNRPHQIDL